MAYAQLLVDARRYETALEQFQILTQSAPENPRVHYALGLLLMQTSRHEEATAPFQKLLEEPELRITAHYYLGQIGERTDDPDVALEHYQQVDRGEHYLNAQIRTAVLLADRGDIDAARAHLQQVNRADSQEDIRVLPG